MSSYSSISVFLICGFCTTELAESFFPDIISLLNKFITNHHKYFWKVNIHELQHHSTKTPPYTTTRKNIFNGGLFLHYLGLKPLLSSLPGVSISPAKPSLENVLAMVFTNPRKHQSITEVFYPLVFNIGFKISVKFCGFKTPG